MWFANRDIVGSENVLFFYLETGLLLINSINNLLLYQFGFHAILWLRNNNLLLIMRIVNDSMIIVLSISIFICTVSQRW